MKKRIALLLSLSMISGLFAGYGVSAEEASDEQVKLVLWHWSDEADWINAYMETHPNVVIEQVFVDAGDYSTKLKQSLAAGTELPDIMFTEASRRGYDLSQDVWEVLTEEPYNFSPDIMLESGLPGMKNQNGDVACIELTASPAAMGYKKDLCREYLGTDDPDELEAMFTSVDDFITKGKEVLEASDGKVKLFSSAEIIGAWFTAMDQKSTKNEAGECVFTDKYKNALEYICEFRDAGVVDVLTAWSPQWHASYAGDYLFFPTAAWSVNYLILGNDPDGIDNWGLFVPPGGGFSWGGTAIGINKHSEHKEEAWDFVYWHVFEEGADIAVSKGDRPGEKVKFEDPEYLYWKTEHFGDQDIGALLFGEVAPNMKLATYTEYDTHCEEVFSLVVQNIMADNSYTAEQALADAIIELEYKLPDVVIK